MLGHKKSTVHLLNSNDNNKGVETLHDEVGRVIVIGLSYKGFTTIIFLLPRPFWTVQRALYAYQLTIKYIYCHAMPS